MDPILPIRNGGAKIAFVFAFLLASSQIYASNMGNGPAAIGVWGIGACIAFAVSVANSKKINPDSGKSYFSFQSFFGQLFLYLVLVFILGVTAIFLPSPATRF